MCFVLKKCFVLCRSVSEYLQFKDIGLVSAVSGIQCLQKTLQSLRSDKKMKEFQQEAENYCQKSKLGFTTFENENTSKRKRTIPAHFRHGSGSLYGKISALHEETSDPSYLGKDRFRQAFYFPFLDRLINELDKRFSSQACEILLLASICHPSTLSTENVEKVKKMAAFFGIDIENSGDQLILVSMSTEVQGWKTEYEKYLKDKELAEYDKTVQLPVTWLCLPLLLKIFSRNGMSTLSPIV